jgi:lipid II:glycine glycyltransferase (peptidoglycan interpeptide bridge formation enzyme)
MKPKCRYNVKLAFKKGVTVREAGEGGLESFYGLLKTTSLRDGIAIHSLDYYRALFREALLYGEGPVRPWLGCYLASQEGEDLAAAIVLHWGTEAVYLYGASADHKRNLMAPYALQFRAMIEAREAGCREYDLFGIPPREDPRHPMAGLYRFKTSFGGRIIHRPGSWDYPCRPLLYRLFRWAEKTRKELRSLRKRRKAPS